MYLTPWSLRPLYEDSECIPLSAVSVESSRMVLVPASSAYVHPGERYDHTLGCSPMAVKITHLPGSVKDFICCQDQYFDARIFAAIPNYVCEKKNGRETS